jgi:hypothetical protein
MKAHVVARVSIDATPPGVFGYLEHLRFHYLWNPSLIKLSPIVALKQGMTYKSTSLLLGIKVQSVNKVSKLVKNRELEVENDSGPLNYRVNYHLETKASKTIVICTTEVSSKSEAFAFAKPVLKLLARRELQTDLQALKIAVENRLQ